MTCSRSLYPTQRRSHHGRQSCERSGPLGPRRSASGQPRRPIGLRPFTFGTLLPCRRTQRQGSAISTRPASEFGLQESRKTVWASLKGGDGVRAGGVGRRVASCFRVRASRWHPGSPAQRSDRKFSDSGSTSSQARLVPVKPGPALSGARYRRHLDPTWPPRVTA
jgi:hypothetical protein